VNAEAQSAPAPAEAPSSRTADEPDATAAAQDTGADTVPVTEAPPPRSSAMDRLALHSASPPSRLGWRLAWLATLALLVVFGGAAYIWRSEIVEFWPPSARVYAAFGVPTAPRTP